MINKLDYSPLNSTYLTGFKPALLQPKEGRDIKTFNNKSISFEAATSLRAAALFKLPFSSNNQSIENFKKVDNNLFRSAQPDENGLRSLANMDVKTLINLRDYKLEELDEEIREQLIGVNLTNKEEVLTLLDAINSRHKKGYIHYVKQKTLSESLGMTWKNISIPSTKEPSSEQIKEFLSHFDNNYNLPVHVHCLEGKDRTGIMVALYKVTKKDERDINKLCIDMREHGLHTSENCPEIANGNRPDLEKFLKNYLENI